MSEQQDQDEALAWDTRGEFAGVENEGFTRPSQEIIDYARSHHLRLNLWSRVVQKVIQLRMQMEEDGQTFPPHGPGIDWIPWNTSPVFNNEESRHPNHGKHSPYDA